MIVSVDTGGWRRRSCCSSVLSTFLCLVIVASFSVDSKKYQKWSQQTNNSCLKRIWTWLKHGNNQLNRKNNNFIWNDEFQPWEHCFICHCLFRVVNFARRHRETNSLRYFCVVLILCTRWEMSPNKTYIENTRIKIIRCMPQKKKVSCHWIKSLIVATTTLLDDCRKWKSSAATATREDAEREPK